MTPECIQLGLYVMEITTPADVEYLRCIRNTCKNGFAHDNTEISKLAQRAWWIVMQDRVKAWLYLKDEDHVIIVGYGLLRQADDGRWWNSVAVLPDYARQGYGAAITSDLLTRHDGPVWAEARIDNVAAVRMHRMTDWELLGYVEDRALFKSREKVTA